MQSERVHLLQQQVALAILMNPLDKLEEPINSNPSHHLAHCIGHLGDNIFYGGHCDMPL